MRVATAIAGEERAHDVVQEAFARAIRENESAAMALGKNPYRVRMIAVICGGAMAAVSCAAILTLKETAWAPLR